MPETKIININFECAGLFAHIVHTTYGDSLEANNRLIFAQESSAYDGIAYPASSFSIYGDKALITLRDTLIELFPLNQE